MPQHKSAEKRMRQNAKRRLRNRLHRNKMRTMIKTLQETDDKEKAVVLLNSVKSCLDSLSAKGIIHKNKAANYKHALEQRTNALG